MLPPDSVTCIALNLGQGTAHNVELSVVGMDDAMGLTSQSAIERSFNQRLELNIRLVKPKDIGTGPINPGHMLVENESGRPRTIRVELTWSHAPNLHRTRVKRSRYTLEPKLAREQPLAT